jgi:protein Mpv17
LAGASFAARAPAQQRLTEHVLTRRLAPQVALNQLMLGPVVVTAVFAWNLGWSRRLAEFPAKWRRDTLPTLRKGWAFWVPASSINFAFVPLQFQVLYMSACGIVWTTILSAASAKA